MVRWRRRAAHVNLAGFAVCRTAHEELDKSFAQRRGRRRTPKCARQVNAPDHGAGAEIDAAYYRWLTASAGYAAPDDIQAAILGELASLAADPDAAARLVPRVPEVITQLLGKLNDDGASHGDLSRQVAQDLVLVAELIREANSAYYRPLTPVRTVEAAIMMLGQNGLRMLLARLAFRPLIRMQAHGFARRAAPHIWNQSEKCALAASLMAPGLSAAAFEAYLAGLMQNVGLVVAFRIADRICPDNQVPGARSFGAALQVHSRKRVCRGSGALGFSAEGLRGDRKRGHAGRDATGQGVDARRPDRQAAGLDRRRRDFRGRQSGNGRAGRLPAALSE
jgi:hypothetical protein